MSARAERCVRICEVCLVVLVGFGTPILNSVFPLLAGVAVDDWDSNPFLNPGLLLKVASGLALLSYMLWIKRRGAALISPAIPSSEELPGPATEAGSLVRRVRQVSRFEWGLVILVAFWPTLALSIFFCVAHLGLGSGVVEQNLPAFCSMVDMVIGFAVLAYVLKRTGRSFRDIGLRWTASGAALALPLFLFDRLLRAVEWPTWCWLGQTYGHPGWHPPDVGAMLHPAGVGLAAIPRVFFIGFFEELIVRAFLMTELIALTQKTWLAIVISVGVQLSYHFYQGVPLALSHVFLFTAFALFYAKTRSILPVALAHALVDLAFLWDYGLRKMLPY